MFHKVPFEIIYITSSDKISRIKGNNSGRNIVIKTVRTPERHFDTNTVNKFDTVLIKITQFRDHTSLKCHFSSTKGNNS